MVVWRFVVKHTHWYIMLQFDQTCCTERLVLYVPQVRSALLLYLAPLTPVTNHST